MPVIPKHIGLAVDMRGCPNRCRHCYIGQLPAGQLSEQDLRDVVSQFRHYVEPGQDKPFFEKITVASWVREPDYGDDYQRLAELEAELSDGPPARYELLSIWRLAHDPNYAPWAKRIGPDTCQVTFFGLEETQDWFCRHRRAFEDSITATERLLDAGMKPRWQLFLTRKILPDLPGLMDLVERMRLPQRVAALGGEFVMFIHAPSFVGEGRRIVQLAATLAHVQAIPPDLLASTRKHFGREELWAAEAEAVARSLTDETPLPYSEAQSQASLWFGIAANWDVFPSIGTGDPWWRLGNLRRDPLATILANFEQNRILPLRLNRPGIRPDLARCYGDARSQRLADSVDDFVHGWLERRCEELYRA